MSTHIILAMFKKKHIMFPSQNRFKGNCCVRKVPRTIGGESPYECQAYRGTGIAKKIQGETWHLIYLDLISWTKQSFCYLPGPMPLGSKFTILPCCVSLEIPSEKHIYIYTIYIYIHTHNIYIYIYTIYIYIYLQYYIYIYIHHKYTHNIFIYIYT